MKIRRFRNVTPPRPKAPPTDPELLGLLEDILNQSTEDGAPAKTEDEDEEETLDPDELVIAVR